MLYRGGMYSGLCSQFVACVVAFVLVFGPFLPLSSQAQPIKVSVKEVEQEPDSVAVPDSEEVVAEVDLQEDIPEATQKSEGDLVLTDQKKEAVDVKAEPSVAGEDKAALPRKKYEAETEETTSDGWPTWAKVGVGVGGAAVLVGAAMAMGGSSPDEPAMATPEGMLGAWHGVAQSGSHTYDGTYNFHSIGHHTYDINTNYDGRKRGTGTWTIIEGTNTLFIQNNSGSTYRGDFMDENFHTINMTTTDGRWSLVLTKY